MQTEMYMEIDLRSYIVEFLNGSLKYLNVSSGEQSFNYEVAWNIC